MTNICKAPNAAQVKATLYFGANIPTGTNLEDQVSEMEFTRFLKEYVVPHFPGFTVATCEGYWKGKPETVRCLTILAMDTDALRVQIRHFAERYKTEFAQEAVAYEFVPCEFNLDCWPFGPVQAYHKPNLGY